MLRLSYAPVAVGLVLFLPAPSAHADKKIVDMTPLFVKESAGCETQARGLRKVSTGATALVATLASPEKEAASADAKRLADGLAQLEAYCADVGAMVTFLKDNAKTAYKSVEKEIDARDNKIRKQRRDAKQLIAELSPITRKLIPMIAKNRVAAPTPVKTTPAKFPSGRAVELPSLGGTWKLSGTSTVDTADYADKTVTASISALTRRGSKANLSCDKHRIVLEKTEGYENVVAAEIPSSSKDLGIVYRITYTRREKSTAPRFYNELCAEKADDVIRVSSHVIPSTNTGFAEQLLPLMTRMLAAHIGVTPPKS